MIHQSLLVATFVAWAVICLCGAVMLFRRAPAASIALFGTVLGAIAGFLVGNADGPAEVPAYTAVGASVGLFVGGVGGLLTTTARPPAKALRWLAVSVLLLAPFAAAALTVLLQVACPLYVRGKHTGFCDYQSNDLLGGWVSGVIVAFLCDAVFLAIVCGLSARQAGTEPASARLY
jgi:hypothetical protein